LSKQAQFARYAALTVAVAMTSLCAGTIFAQDYPSKPVRIVTTAIGGGNDFVARLIAQSISGPLGQPVIVDNRATGVIPGDVVARSAPDGHTLLVAGNTLWVGPLLEKTPYDAIRDFSPISLASWTPSILVVHPSLPAKSVKELIALARGRPGDLNYASTATGGSSHLATELFKHMAGVDLVRVPYKGNAPATVDLTGGQVHLMFAIASAVAPLIQSGRLRALAVTSARPSALFPGVPTVAASGVPGYESVTLTGVFAPARTPPAIIGRLNREIVEFLGKPQTIEKYLSAGMETVGSSPERLGVTIKAEIARMGNVIKNAGIRAD
jgi:tripartite-type tricarboxylate transporter receptor subunit TctC